MLTDLRYEITGKVNDEELFGLGKGSLNTDTGEAYLDVAFDSLPRGWDPKTVALICCNRGMAMASKEHGTAKNLLTLSNGIIRMGGEGPNDGPRRGGVMYLPSGERVANIRAAAQTDLMNENYDRSQVSSESWSKLEPGKNGISKILTPFEGVMLQPGNKLVSVLTQYEVELEDGTQGVYGSTHYPHYMPKPSNQRIAPQKFTVEDVETHLQGNELELYTKTSVAPLEVVVKNYSSRPTPWMF